MKNYIETDSTDAPHRLDLPDDATVAEIKAAAIRLGLSSESDPEKIQVFLEDEDSELDETARIQDLPDHGKRRRRFFCGPCKKLVKVEVQFECEDISSKFWAGARLQRVLDWATAQLKLTDADAENLGFRTSKDDSEPLSLDTMLGSLASRRTKCAVGLFLCPIIHVNGNES